MKTCVALFRGINVGGKNILPMKNLVSLLTELGATDVKTYIQSGNAVFRCEETDTSLLSDDIGLEIERRHGFTPQVFLIPADELEIAMVSNPFPEAENDPKTLHLFFLTTEPDTPDLDALENIRNEDERFILEGCILYLHAPDGIGRSKLAANVEKLLGVPATARNWRTVYKVMEMAKQL